MWKRTAQRTLARAIGLVVVLGCIGATSGQDLDFGVSDDQSYQSLKGAIGASEYVRYDYVNVPKPRVVAAVAGLLEFATRNPLAGEETLSAFAQAYSAALWSGAPGDQDLHRAANFMPVVQFSTPLSGVAALEGFDTDVGARVLELLRMNVPAPLNWDGLADRMVQFDQARLRRFGNAAEWSNLLVIGFMGRDLDGNDRPEVTAVMRSFLESEGFEPVPDGIDDGRFSHVNDGLMQMPANYAAYQSAITCLPGEETPPIWSGIESQFAAISAVTDARLAELQTALLDEPSLIEGLNAAQAPGYLDQLAADLQARLDEVAMPRTILAANTLLMLQNSDPGIRQLAYQSQDFSCITLETNETMAGIGSGVQVLAGLALIGFGIAQVATGVGGFTGAVTIVGGVTLLAGGAFGLADAFGLQIGEPTPSADQQILDQIIEVRMDIENMRVQMNQRFDRIEAQLNVIYQGIATGFNQIAMQIEDLSLDVEALTREVIVVHATLERIEDALYAMAEDLLEATLQFDVNLFLNYRPDTGVDLPYTSAGNQNYLNGANTFFTYAVDIAQNQSFAGPTTSTLTIASADETLNGDSIGRNVNDLRVFPASQLGLSALLANRTVAPGPWAQGAAAYSQLAHESRWYFAYQYEQQMLASGPGVVPDIERIIQEGQDLASAAANGRSQALFDALFAGYNSTVDDIDALIKQMYVLEDVIPYEWHEETSVVVDPLGGVEQDVQPIADEYGEIIGLCWPPAELNVVVNSLTDVWSLFPSNSPELQSVVSFPGIITWCATQTELDFIYEDFECGGNMARRDIGFELSPPPMNPPTNFEDYIMVQWGCDVLRDALLSGENLAGQTIHLPACNGYPATDMIIMSDDYQNLAGFCDPSLVAQIEEELEPYIDPALAVIIDELSELQGNSLKDLTEILSDWESLIEAYVTFSLPEAMEYSDILRAGLRASPITGELSLRGESVLPTMIRMRDGLEDVRSVSQILKLRAQYMQEEINSALELEAQGHSYLNWMLADLIALRDNAFELAVDDAYATEVGQPLMVSAVQTPGGPCQNVYQSGLMANDVDQPCRVIEVDTAFAPADGYVAPMHGSISVGADGSFIYTPDPGYEGTDLFTYRIGTSVDEPALTLGELDQFVWSNPATVRIIVGDAAPVPCPGDTNGDSIVNITDLNVILGNFQQSGAPGIPGDLNGDGMVNIVDLNQVLGNFQQSCP